MRDSAHSWPVAPNLLNQDFTADAPDHKWGADISDIWTAEGWLYLLIDLFSPRVPRVGLRPPEDRLWLGR